MEKIRINDLARELEVKSRAILDVLPVVGVTEKKTHSSSISVEEAERVRAHVRGKAEGGSSGSRPARVQGEQDIKTKIDLSQISRPGDVLKAISSQQAPAAPRRPAPPPRIPEPPQVVSPPARAARRTPAP